MIMLGEYPGRATLTVERLAQNINDCGGYGLADTAGKVLVGEPTDPDGPVAYHATVPVHEMVLAMRAAGIPADVSDAAGTFVCNHLMYGVLHHIASRNLPIRAGWSICPVCRWSPPWIATWVFRACRWRRRSRDWSPASSGGAACGRYSPARPVTFADLRALNSWRPDNPVRLCLMAQEMSR